MSLWLFLLGGCRLRVGAEARTAFLNLCLREGITFRDFRVEETGEVTLRCSLPTARRLMRLCASAGFSVAVQRSGLPSLLWRYRRRAGAVLGLLMAVALLLLSERFVWDVRVIGNVGMTRSEVLEELRSCGFGVGSYIPSVQTRELENRVLLRSDRISWISVYLDGTVAVVQVIEQSPPPAPPATSPANLVAACDGQIELLMLYRGNAVVKVGQAVHKGDLLVSGLYDSDRTGYRYTRAAGEVYARTERSFTVEIPFSYVERCYGEAILEEISLNFFDFSIKIFKRGGNYPSACDIMKGEISADTVGLPSLPLRMEVSRALPYTEREATRSPEAAVELAYAQLAEELGALSEEIRLLRKDVSVSLTDDGVLLTCRVSCIENIAVSVDFEITQ